MVHSLPPHSARVVRLDTQWGEFARQSDDNPVNEVVPSNTAYVIYTSGSTGKPKGVVIEHQSAVTLLHWAREIFRPEELATVVASTSICFDLSVFELFVPLSCGGKVILAVNALQLPALKDAAEVTLINTVPSAMSELVQAQAVPKSVRTVNLAGEPLQTKLVQDIYRQKNIERVFNLYGPSEDTTYSTVALMPRDATGAASIGRPIANSQAYILDAHWQPVPTGVAGELYLGGAGLARGYINRSDLTAEKFIPDAFGTQPGARLYRTGDLVRYADDGKLEFLGRADQQVKIRGYRIELGEIESVLMAHKSVREAAVVVREEVANNKQLVAYVVLADDTGKLNNGNLRNWVRTKLPEYMTPSVFVQLKELPLTPNGKVDRRALPAPEPIAPEHSGGFVSPRDFLELQLTRIWEEVLGVNPISLQQNFFDLGGHSLLALRLMSQIQRLTGRDLPLSLLFDYPTVETLAAHLRRQTGAKTTTSSLVGIQPRGDKSPIFFVHSSGGHVFRYVNLARELGSDRPFYGLQAMGVNDDTAHKKIEDMAAHYLDALLKVQSHGPYLLGGWSMGGVVAYEMAQRLLDRGEQIASLALIDSRAPHPFDQLREVDDEVLLAQFVYDVGLSPEGLDIDWKRFVRLSENYQLTHLMLQAKRSNLMLPELELSRVRRLFEMHKINMRAMLDYVPRIAPLKVTLFKATEKLMETPVDATLGWSGLAGKGVDVHAIPGHHFSMIDYPHVHILAEQLRASLNGA